MRTDAMDFELSDDQQALRDAATELLDDRAGPAQVRAVVDAGLPFDGELWKAMVDQGWTGIAVPEDAGGVGLGWVEVAVLAEAVGAHVAPAPIVQSMIAVDALRGTPWVDGRARGRSRSRASARPGRPRGRAVRARPPTSRCAGAVTSSSSPTSASSGPRASRPWT